MIPGNPGYHDTRLLIKPKGVAVTTLPQLQRTEQTDSTYALVGVSTCPGASLGVVTVEQTLERSESCMCRHQGEEKSASTQLRAERRPVCPAVSWANSEGLQAARYMSCKAL